jgi:hypothetical protein
VEPPKQQMVVDTLTKLDIQERRKYFVHTLVRTISLRSALEATSQKFGVSIPVLRVDWSRRSKWPRELFDAIDDPVFEELCQLAIIKTLRQIERIIVQNENPNCQLGALKLKTTILFKLRRILQEKIDQKLLIERVNELEEKVKSFFSDAKKGK